MSDERCPLIVAHGLPVVVRQALDDVQLPHAARLLMWHLSTRLDFVEWREVKGASLAHETRMKESTVYRTLALLTARGYLDSRAADKRARAYRLAWSRRQAA